MKIQMHTDSNIPQPIMLRDSLTDPLQIDVVRSPRMRGAIGITLCPGKQGQSTFGYHWNREMSVDLREISVWRPQLWINLMEPIEMLRYKVQSLPFQAESLSPYLSMPVRDLQAPGKRFSQAWAEHGDRTLGVLARGGRVLVHCRGGIGRSGVLAARILIDFGHSYAEAISIVRKARSNAVESHQQHAWLQCYAALHNTTRSA